METILLIIHLLIAIALVGVILLQRSEGGALGIGGSGSGVGGMFSARGSANLLTRTTAILAIMFIATSLLLAIVSGRYGDERTGRNGITQELEQTPLTTDPNTQNDTQNGTQNGTATDTNAPPLVPFGE